MTFTHSPLLLLLIALLAACSDNQKAADNKQPAAQVELTAEEKFAKLNKDAESGNAIAQSKLGWMYENGEGVPKDVAKAVEWYQKAAESGEMKAQTALGKMYAEGEVVPKDSTKALELYQKAAAQGDAEAQYKLWLMLDVFWIEIDSTGVPRNKDDVPKDTDKAFEWLQKAAAQGYADAQYALSSAYEPHVVGRGVMGLYSFSGTTPDAAKRVDLLQKAAAQGHAGALHELAGVYERGEGVPRNLAKSAELVEKAAAQGDADAQSDISRRYLNGERGVNRDLVRGYAWKILQASDGNSTTKHFLDIVERKLTPDQIAEGQRLASNWKKGDILQAAGDISPNASAPGGAPTKQGLGTGFVVSSLGYALTNHHVIDGCKEIRVTGQDGVINVVTSDTVNDLALLQMPGRANFATLTDNPAKLRQGEDIVVYGYPLNYLLSSGGNLTPGTVSALSGLGNNTNQIQITAPIQPGSSGSPVMDKKGNIVGVVSTKLSDSKMAKATGQVGQNVNFAVNGQTVKAFLDANKVSYKTGGGLFSREKSNADIAEEARKWTVVLECWK